MSAMPSLFLLGALCLFGQVQGQMEDQVSAIANLKTVAMNLTVPLTCSNLNCECAFKSERGCCCGANDMYDTETAVYMRMKDLFMKLYQLKNQVQELTTERKVAFQARMTNSIATGSSTLPCFGPFNIDVSIPFDDVMLDDKSVYNKALGTFTAQSNGVYMFSFTITSAVEENALLYHKVELCKDSGAIVAVWENNREDFQDSATQYVILELNKGNQVYLRLVAGRKICTTLSSNMFSGFLLYPL